MLPPIICLHSVKSPCPLSSSYSPSLLPTLDKRPWFFLSLFALAHTLAVCTVSVTQSSDPLFLLNYSLLSISISASFFFFHNSGQKSNTTKHLPKFSQVHRIFGFSSQYCVLDVSFVYSWFVHKLKVFAVHVVPLVRESSQSTVTLPWQACSAGTDWITTYIPAVELNCTGQITLQINKWSCSVQSQESNYFLLFFFFFHNKSLWKW